MNDVKRPLPRTDEPDTAAFWAATRDKKLTFPRCRDCGAMVFYPRRHCTSCLGSNLETIEASGRGKVYTYSVIRQSYHPFYRTRVPYAVAWVDLEEGPRILTNVVGVDDPSSDVTIGIDVDLVWEEYEEVNVPLFKPAAT